MIAHLMIVSRVHEAALERGVENANQLSVRCGLHAYVAWRLWRGEYDKISIDSLDKLCAGLGCAPGDLLAYVPQGKTAASSGKPAGSATKRKVKR